MSKMICLSGMPGSGKTTWALEFLKNFPDYLYFSPDEYYKRFNGDDRDRSNTFEVWMAMFQDINTAMKNGQNVLVDSDNLTYHQRMQWIEWFPEFEHQLVFFEEDIDVCCDRVEKRRRTIPIEIMMEKWLKWERPARQKDGRYWDIYTGSFGRTEFDGR